MSDKTGGRVVFVGNIPYDQSEEQIMDVFQSVGPVANFRFVFDKETGRPKGYGFVEYHDAETAASAVRNLNNYELSNRALRVDFSHESSIGPNVLTSNKPRAQDATLPPLPIGTVPAPNLATPDAISNTLSSFTAPQMLSILQELKTVVATNPAKARELLKVSPQLSYAVVQGMLLMGLVDATAVAKAFEPSQLVGPQQRATSTPPPAAGPGVSQQAYAGAGYSSGSPASRTGTPTVPTNIDPQKAALIRQVMEFTDEQLAAFPENQRLPIVALREKIRRGEY
ncbi:hypothetical protein POJ06DRAFT_248935 [Lipomyces tetrasporus]|uniref:RRM domain-containing protein n=1 Tax=Lipomyces tetrasporus TaxID=54092 RepID=A0AAD7QWF5_9ASCO|nr:uncharacterized protein POJ06DRAFT_248935 [Lipomyces tetrasporus]KAJ8102156.1 hypothetical protein POJ06DRAFT_248935 [Lipomyces tetrasporus]